MPAEQKYPRPPIIEAVIEFQFHEHLSAREMDRLRDRFNKRYSSVEEERRFEFAVEPGGRFKQTDSVLGGYKLTAGNASDVVLIRPQGFATARLAPYPGWEALREIAEVNLTGAKKVIGRRHPSRIGVRYINRIDIPWSQLDGRDLGEFLKLGVALPRDIDRGMSAYSLSVEFREKETDIKVVVRSGTVVPVLIDHFSLMLDLDLILDRDIPGRPEGWWERLDLVRKAKNRVFEASITDKVRELFQ